MQLNLNIDPRDRSPEACRERAMHAQRMLELRPDGNGFRRVPEHSNQVSIVERHLIEAGDMKAPTGVPGDRNYRSKRREPDERQKRRQAVARKEAEKLVPFRNRGIGLEPNEHLVEQVSDAFKGAKSPVEFVLAFIARLGISSMDEYDRLATRAERFMRSVERNPGKRVPNHIRDRFVMKRLVELVIAKRWPSVTAPVTA